MTETGAIYYAKHADVYVIKLTGEVRYQLGCAFDDFLKQIFGQGDFSDIVLDLTEATMIDSTCLGLLAKIANEIHHRFNRKVTVFSTNEDINQILNSVGFFSIFDICASTPEGSGNGQQITTCDIDRAHLAQTLYDAHLVLSELNDTNRQMFKNVLEGLQDKVVACPVSTPPAAG